MQLPKTFSYTAMMDYLRCSMQYRLKYIDKIPGKLTGDLIHGNAYHNALGVALSEKVIYKDLAPWERVLKAYNDTWNTSVNRQTADEEGKLTQVKDIDWGKNTPEEMRRGGETVLKLYYDGYIRKYEPREIEVWKRCNYHGIQLVGKIDVITKDYKVIDHKTSGKSLSDDELLKEMQSCFYAILLGMDELNFELHQAVIKKESEINIFQVKRTKNQIDWVGDLIIKTWTAINMGIFIPTGMNGYWCSPTACTGWDICHATVTQQQLSLEEF